MFWLRHCRLQVSLLRVQGASFKRTVTVSRKEKVRHITTLSRLDTLDHGHEHQKEDTTRDYLDERIGECSKRVGERSQIDQMRSDIPLPNGQTGSEYAKLDQMNEKVSRLISNDQVDEAIRLYQDWQRTSSSAQKEENLSSEKQKNYLYQDTVRNLIRWCLLNDEKRTSQQVLFALCQEKVPPDHQTAQLLQIYVQSRTDLILLLPVTLRNLLYLNQVQEESDGKLLRNEFCQKIGEDVRVRLLIPIAIALVQQEDLRLAHWMLRRHKVLGVQKMPIGTANLFAEAAIQHANSSTTKTNGKDSIKQIVFAMRFLQRCQDVEDDALIKSNATILRNLSEIMKQDEIFSLWQLEKWREILRKLSLISLRSGTLMIKSLQSSKSGIAALIPLHIKAEDYTFAKRLFELYQDYYGRYTNESPFDRIEFAWLFETSLKVEDSVDFIVKLFNHWLISDLSSEERMPHFLPSQLRRFSYRLMKANRGDEVLPLLSLFELESGTESIVERQRNVVRKIEKKGQARRTISVFANASPKYFHEFIPLLQQLLSFLRDRSEGHFDDHLIGLHLFVINKSRKVEKYATSLPLVRAQMLSIVENMRQHAVKVAKSKRDTTEDHLNMTSETNIALQMLYTTILRYLGDSLATEKAVYRFQDENRDIHLADALDNTLNEMQSLWSMDLEEVNRKSINSAITICKLQIMMGRKDWQSAFALYSETMNKNAEDWERFVDLAETGENKRTFVNPPPPFALNVATRLALALGQGGQFDKARQVLSMYTHCTKHFKSVFSREKGEENNIFEERVQAERKIKDHDRVLIESTGIALLCMQDRTEEALGRIYSLERLGVFGAPPQPQTPLMFFSEEKQTQRAGFNFNSNIRPTLFSAVTPSIGPTNKDLTITYIDALATIPMKAKSADWQGLLANSQKQLSKYTGAMKFSELNRS